MLQFDVYFCLTNFTFEDQSRPKLDLMYSCKFANTHSIKTFEKENNQKGALILVIKDNQRLSWLWVIQTQQNTSSHWTTLPPSKASFEAIRHHLADVLKTDAAWAEPQTFGRCHSIYRKSKPLCWDIISGKKKMVLTLLLLLLIFI